MKISFAVMEILKAMAVLFRLFNVTRIKSGPTILREGFFNKATECTATIERR
jgi:benzoate 4-monooxygenase